MHVLHGMSQELTELKKVVVALDEVIRTGKIEAMTDDVKELLEKSKHGGTPDLTHICEEYMREADKVVLEREQEGKRDDFKRERKEIEDKLSQLETQNIRTVLEISNSEVTKAVGEIEKEVTRTETRLRSIEPKMKEEGFQKILQTEHELLEKRKEFALKAIERLNMVKGKSQVKHTPSVASMASSGSFIHIKEEITANYYKVEQLGDLPSHPASPSSTAPNSRKGSMVDVKHMPLIEEESLYMKSPEKSRPRSPTIRVHHEEVGTTTYESGRSTPWERGHYSDAATQTIEQELARRRHLRDFLPQRFRDPNDPEEKNARKFARTLVHEYSTKRAFPFIHVVSLSGTEH